jgi:hypothetical protein
MTAIFTLIDAYGALIDALVITAMVAAIMAWLTRRWAGR